MTTYLPPTPLPQTRFQPLLKRDWPHGNDSHARWWQHWNIAAYNLNEDQPNLSWHLPTVSINAQLKFQNIHIHTKKTHESYKHPITWWSNMKMQAKGTSFMNHPADWRNFTQKRRGMLLWYSSIHASASLWPNSARQRMKRKRLNLTWNNANLQDRSGPFFHTNTSCIWSVLFNFFTCCLWSKYSEERSQ